MAKVVSRGSLHATTGINFLLGVWLFLSPWFYATSSRPDIWSSWIVGLLIAVFAAFRYFNPSTARGLSVMNVLFGAWTFFSPWIFHYVGNGPHLANSIVVGLAVFVLGLFGSSSVAPMIHRPPEAQA